MINKFDLEKRRKELNLTLEQIGNFVGVSKSTVKKWESGYIDNMKRDKIALLAKILRVSPLDIIGVEPDIVEKEKNDKVNQHSYTAHEHKVITAYRAKPEMQPAVDTLLGIKNTDDTTPQKPFIAAASGKEYKAKALDLDTMIEIEKSK